MTQGLQPYLREMVSSMASGEIRTLPRSLYDTYPMKRLRSGLIQSATIENVTIEVRTINDELYVKRVDITRRKTMPGVPPRITNRELADAIRVMSPFPGEDDYELKIEAMNYALEALG